MTMSGISAPEPRWLREAVPTAGGAQCTMPVRMAIATAWARSFALSFSKMRSRWVLTVCGEIAELAGHLPGRGAVGNLLEDLAFAFGQGRGLGRVARRCGLDLLDERLRELRVDHRVAFDRVLGRVDQGVGRGVLQQVPRDTRLDRFGDGASRLVDGDQDDLGVGSSLSDPPRRLDAVHAGHANVHEHDVGAQFACSFDGFLSAGGFAHDEHGVVRERERGSSPSRVTGWSSTMSARIGGIVGPLLFVRGRRSTLSG